MDTSILDNVENAIFFGEEGCGEGVASSLILETIMLELEIKHDMNLIPDRDFAKKYMPVVSKYKQRTDWSLNGTNEEYLKWLKKDVYIYFCLRGLEQLNLSSSGKRLSISNLYDRFYEVLGKIMRYYKYVPERIDDIVYNQMHRFKAYVCYDYYDSATEADIEPVLFMLGLWEDIRKKVKEINMKQNIRKRRRTILRRR